MNYTQILSRLFSVALAFFVFGCNTDDPKKEDAPELITKVTLTFTPVNGGTPIVVSASDPDGEGVQDLAPEDEIVLADGTAYDLSLELINELAAPTEEGYDISEEVKEEGDEHMFFYGWTNDLFSSPTGNGNIDSRADQVIYTDNDSKNLPIGLLTRWTTIDTGSAHSHTTPTTGTFRIVLKHQPGLKNGTSGVNIGETDMDITFSITLP